MKLKIGSLFSGYGGFELAGRWCGWKTIFQCEKNKYCRLLLKKNFRGPVIYNDINDFNAQKYDGTIHIICGGDPCQPSSLQGEQKGVQDHRYLWPPYLRIVNEVHPAWVINENVPGSIFNGILDGKISDLEAAGYTCWPPLLIPASATGTIHQRERVFLVAYADGRRFEQLFAAAITVNQGKRAVSRQSRSVTPIRLQAGHTSLSRILRAADGTTEGLSPRERNQGIQAGGNGVSPHVVYGIFKEIDRITEEYINTRITNEKIPII